ncbi:hypothetical protein ACIPK7_18250 [Pseudomonas sp. NPDC086581]|uniref:hypothetical protein n=1 Tax=Pseudomonas sp. NPDC086581 TaxID=3364432 RepID=UPI00380D3142
MEIVDISRAYLGENQAKAWDELWKGARASGGMDDATLETVVRCYGYAEQALFISLSPPMGKNLEMQCGFWSWLQAYMNNGRWFDEDGQRSRSDIYVKETVAIGEFRLSDNVARYWRIGPTTRLVDLERAQGLYV